MFVIEDVTKLGQHWTCYRCEIYEFLSVSIFSSLLTFVQRVMVNVSPQRSTSAAILRDLCVPCKHMERQMQNLFDLHGTITMAFTSLLHCLILKSSTLS